MDMITSAIVVISICCVMAIKIFVNDDKHDLEIQAQNFRLSIKKHDWIELNIHKGKENNIFS